MGYLFLDVMALFAVRRYMVARIADPLRYGYSRLEPPVSVVVPAYNEEGTVEATVSALLQLEYGEYEVIVVNDGSHDGTMRRLIEAYALEPFPEAYRVRLATQHVRGHYRSRTHVRLRVIDKDNGGKADSLNAGINAARYPLFCAVDADSILQRDSLRRAARPFTLDSRTVATGGTVRVANGCRVRGGFLEQVALPRNPLATMQVVEYLRAFLFGRLGWSPLNALPIISGTFGLFQKETVVAVGGYRTDTLGEDMELVVRLHRILRAQRRPYRITFVPDPICWTEVPEDFRTLARQRMRWHRGLLETLWMNRSLPFSPTGGLIGWVSLPFVLIFEAIGPVVELVGFVAFPIAAVLGLVSPEALVAFLAVAVGVGMLLSVSALLLEELSFHVYPRGVQGAVLFFAALGENFGMRQLNSLWRFIGLWRWVAKRRAVWGVGRRIGGWAHGVEETTDRSSPNETDQPVKSPERRDW